MGVAGTGVFPVKFQLFNIPKGRSRRTVLRIFDLHVDEVRGPRLAATEARKAEMDAALAAILPTPAPLQSDGPQAGAT